MRYSQRLLRVVCVVLVTLTAGSCGSSNDMITTGEFRIASTQYGAVNGTVLYEDIPVPGVTVAITPGDQGRQQVAVTNIDGAFLFSNVTPGQYTITAELEGFSPVVQIINVRSGMRLALALGLRNPGVMESITVTAAAPPQSGTIRVDRRSQPPSARPAPPAPRSIVPQGQPIRSAGIVGSTYAPVPNEEYAPIHANRFVDAGEDPVSTFSIDVDRASYANVRRFIRDGLLPPPDAVRTEELINYFRYDDPAPSGESIFAVSTEMTAAPWKRSHRLLRIAIRGRELAEWEQRPNNLVFLIDVSGSMKSPDKLPLLKRSMRMLVDQLDATDTVAIVTYADTAQLVLSPTPGNQKWFILDAIERLHAEGSTAGARGIQLAYETIRRSFVETGSNRVILATDGDFNVGVSSREELEHLIETEREAGIFLSVLGFGTGNLKDAKMEVLADKGNGNYGYIDSILEARKSLVEEIGGTLQTIARDVKIQVEFDPRFVSEYKLIGYENRLMADADFADDRKDAGELGSGHSVTALYEIVPRGSTAGARLAEVRLRYKAAEEEESRLLRSWALDDGSGFESASTELQFASAVARYGMLLRERTQESAEELLDVLAVARRARGTDANGYRGEFIQLVETTVNLIGTDRYASDWR